MPKPADDRPENAPRARLRLVPPAARPAPMTAQALAQLLLVVLVLLAVLFGAAAALLVGGFAGGLGFLSLAMAFLAHRLAKGLSAGG